MDIMDDNWYKFSLIILVSSVICCGLIPIFLRLWLARKRYYRYCAERSLIEQCMPFAFNIQKSIYSDLTPELCTSISFQHETPTTPVSESNQLYSTIYSEIPFIDSKDGVADVT
ncbi:unnamed protein product [Didymodactylos carnosus]|uniref:Uncharacterized protein n=1 Tax=Didymodactylos carnosus TaxID=1234261 RepID=A0A814FP25_9BILA|nr:unnamed protein product [Didymodactylos carnosus]CAF0982784.1 unnamed protein product [Didymodactylos carnosus]CAF3669201.1 unnamed protein product [Didymodactylos carnosus]CAF3755230.1 unnamed protein product [Didymodactylos carnosus]